MARGARVERGNHLPVFRSDDGGVAGDRGGYPRVLEIAREVDPVGSLQARFREVDCLHHLKLRVDDVDNVVGLVHGPDFVLGRGNGYLGLYDIRAASGSHEGQGKGGK